MTESNIKTQSTGHEHRFVLADIRWEYDLPPIYGSTMQPLQERIGYSICSDCGLIIRQKM